MIKKKKNIQKENVSQDENVIFTISAKEYGELDEQKRSEWTPIRSKYEKVPIFCIVSLIITVVSAILYVSFEFSANFADFFNRYISMPLRILLAKITNILPISLAELIIILLPVIGFISIWYLLKFRCETKRSSMIATFSVLSAAGLLLSSFVWCFAAGYRVPTLDKRLGLVSEPISAQELYETTEYLTEKINELTPSIKYSDDGFSQMPYSFSEMNTKLIQAYDKFCEKYDFITNFDSKIKPIVLSKALSYTHITGVYTFFTGESNLNVNFPDYTIPFTAAHELAHQRGIAREDEANMIAFLVCMESDDPYIRYSAYTNVYEFVASALSGADRELYNTVRPKIASSFYNEQVAFSSFFEKYRKSVASQVSGAVNDAYLVSQGTVGKQSYGMVVDLTVAYYKHLGIIN